MNYLNRETLREALNALSIDNATNTEDFKLVDAIFSKADELDAQKPAPDEREYPPYGVMIQNLFKKMEGPHSTTMHAAIGIMGEAVEWGFAPSHKNVREEGGDMEFYVEALKQQFDFSTMEIWLDTNDTRVNVHVGNVFDNIIALSGDILDVVKKSWVYNKDLNTKELVRLLCLLEYNMIKLYSFYELERRDVQYANMVKLIGPGGRFESGFYSDAQAVARKDKPPIEDRSFFGKKPNETQAEADVRTGKIPQAEIQRPDFV